MPTVKTKAGSAFNLPTYKSRREAYADIAKKAESDSELHGMLALYHQRMKEKHAENEDKAFRNKDARACLKHSKMCGDHSNHQKLHDESAGLLLSRKK